MKTTALAFAAALFLSPAAQAQTTDALMNMSTVDVSATVEVKSAPDIAQISAGVITTAPTAAAAMKENAAQMTKVFGALKDAGIAEKDIQTAGINVNAQYAYQEGRAPRVTGYQAANTVSVTLRNLDAAGKTLDTLVSAGANNINGPSFSVENPEELLDKARADAVRKAQKRAELLATAAGMRVKRLITLSENTQEFAPQPRMMMKAMAMDAATSSTPVSPGQVGLSATVTARFELMP